MELDLRVAADALDADLDTTIYRLAQEALANVGKHVRAARIAVVVEQVPGELRVRIEDDGRGFDIAEPGPDFGLAGMHERAALMGGRLAIEWSAAGTAVTATIRSDQSPSSR